VRSAVAATGYSAGAGAATAVRLASVGHRAACRATGSGAARAA
jgi:hypothetical protein